MNDWSAAVLEALLLAGENKNVFSPPTPVHPDFWATLGVPGVEPHNPAKNP